MSSYAWMRVLESSAARYDRGIALLSGGRIGSLYRRIAELATAAGPSARVLDIGCGTGGVALACVARGAKVVGIDRNAAMLEVAREKPLPEGAAGSVAWLELGAMEIEDRFDEHAFDAVVSCLAFSEMTPDEQAYVLDVACTRLKPGGRLVVADEVAPRGALRRLRYVVRRWPVALLAYLLTQATTRPVQGLPGRVRAAGFVEVDEKRMWGDAMSIVEARAPADPERTAAPAPRGEVHA